MANNIFSGWYGSEAKLAEEQYDQTELALFYVYIWEYSSLPAKLLDVSAGSSWVLPHEQISVAPTTNTKAIKKKKKLPTGTKLTQVKFPLKWFWNNVSFVKT